MHDSPRLAALAARHGVSTEYHDWRGERTSVERSTLVAVLAALDVDASSDEAIERSLLEADDHEWRQALPPSLIARAGAAKRFAVHVPHGAAVRVELDLEDGSVRPLEQLDVWTRPRTVDGSATGRATFELPNDVPKGWHELRAHIEGATAPSAVATVAIVPNRAPVDDAATWGIMAQLYQVRSADSWGVGDLRDASTLTGWAASHGADFVLLNPLHAPAPVVPVEPSPYLPVTRRFVDPSVVHVEDLPAYRRLADADAARITEMAATVKRTNDLDTIDRDAMWTTKRDALAACFDVDLEDATRREDFERFCASEGVALTDFATYCAIAERHGRDWGSWPEDLRSPSSPGASAFRDEHAAAVDFFRWLQWTVDEQLAALQAGARDAGMRIGVIHDLAVGVHPLGADTWAMPETLARGVSVGAPPDAFNQLGQDWSQPPWRPDRLAALGYAPFRDMLRAIFRHAGGVRIDHILGLFRLWWIPAGSGPDRGAYVHYDPEAMLGVLLLEAERAGARVIGEDLGVVEASTRVTLADRGVAGTSILWWEWDGDEPLAPQDYRKACLAAVTTHDLPPTAGFLELAHVDLRERLGLLARDVESERAAELSSINRVLDRVDEAGCFAHDSGEANESGDRSPQRASTSDRVVALHRYVAASSANAFGVAVADLAGDRRSVNQPGTYREYPNWSVPLSGPSGELVSLEDVMASPFAARLAEASTRRRGSVTRSTDESE